MLQTQNAFHIKMLSAFSSLAVLLAVIILSKKYFEKTL